MIYIGYCAILFILLMIERYNVTLRRICRIIIPLLYVILIGWRDSNVGVDTPVYYEHYYTFGKWGCEFVEPGFNWLNQFLYALGYGANAFFMVIAVITVLFLYLTLNKLDKEYTISAFCLYLLTFTFLVNGMRQGVVCAIFLYAYRFIEQQKFIRYILLLLCASLFHASALLLIPLYFLKRYSLPLIGYIILYILSFCGVFFDLSPYIPHLDLGVRDYSVYVDNIKISQASYLGFVITSFLNVLVFVLMCRNKILKTNPLLFNLVFLSFILKNIGFNIPIVGRITIYFSWFLYLVYPLVLGADKFPLFRSRFVTYSLILVINAAIWLNGILSPANKLLPYKFYWEDAR